jgi:GNAT superfamily N-acetyltransferase
MTSQFKITLEADPKPVDMQVVVKGLTEYNASHSGGEVPEPLVITVRDTSGAVTGGLVGATYLGWLLVQGVWLPEARRGHGIGRMLMATAEEEALGRKCDRAFLETFSFQALDFYLKCGYTVFSRLEGMPPGGARFALTKYLRI